MNATPYFDRVRQLLDDPEESAQKKGYFWEPNEIVSALNYSQHSIVTYLCKKKESYLLQRIIATVDGSMSVPIPANYYYHLTGQVLIGGTYRNAQLYLTGISRTFWSSQHYCVAVLKDYAYFRADARYVSGRLVYYKKPSVMTIDDSSSVFYEADSFDRTLYDVIANHAAACLSARQEPTPRLMKNLQQSIKFLMEDPIDQVIPLPEGIA